MQHGDEMTERLTVDSNVPFKDAKQQIIEEFEKKYLVELLQKHNHNLSKASREAGIDRKHLRNLCKKYGIHTKE